jgi:hypothetical protein
MSKQALHAALYKFFSHLGLKNHQYLTHAYLTLDGEIVSHDTIPRDEETFEFLPLNRAVAKITENVLYPTELSIYSDKNFNHLFEFFIAMTQMQGITLCTPLYDPMRRHLCDIKAVAKDEFKPSMQFIAIKTLFEMMQTFSKEIANIDISYLENTFGNVSLARIRIWALLPSINTQLFLWASQFQPEKTQRSSFIKTNIIFATDYLLSFAYFYYTKEDEDNISSALQRTFRVHRGDLIAHMLIVGAGFYLLSYLKQPTTQNLSPDEIEQVVLGIGILMQQLEILDQPNNNLNADSVETTRMTLKSEGANFLKRLHITQSGLTPELSSKFSL